MITDDQLRKIVAELSQTVTELSQTVTKMSREMAEAHEKTEAQMAKIEAQIAEAHKKTEAPISKSDRKMESLFEELADDLTKEPGEIAKEFFYHSLANNPCLAGMRFDRVHHLEGGRAGGPTGEYDIVLANSDTLVLVEVSARAKPKICEYIIKTKIPDFRKLFPPFCKNHKIIGAVASMVSNDELAKTAREKGLLLLTQQGDHICLVNDHFIEF